MNRTGPRPRRGQFESWLATFSSSSGGSASPSSGESGDVGERDRDLAGPRKRPGGAFGGSHRLGLERIPNLKQQ
jgi:hypothetical protein